MQASSENRYISCANVSFNIITKEYSVAPQLIASGTYAKDTIEDDPIVEELFKKYFPDSDPYDVIGYNRSIKNSETILNKVAELYYQKGLEVWGEQYDNIVLGGGYLNARNPYNVYSGDVTYADLYSVLPFDNAIVLGRIKGRDLKKQFLDKDRYHIYPTLNSSNISDSGDYYIIVDTYTSTYRYNNITEIDRLDGEIYARDLLADFIRGGGWA